MSYYPCEIRRRYCPLVLPLSYLARSMMFFPMPVKRAICLTDIPARRMSQSSALRRGLSADLSSDAGSGSSISAAHAASDGHGLTLGSTRAQRCRSPPTFSRGNRGTRGSPAYPRTRLPAVSLLDHMVESRLRSRTRASWHKTPPHPVDIGGEVYTPMRTLATYKTKGLSPCLTRGSGRGTRGCGAARGW